jgi:ABC-type Zn uptake system ZnuABC Zn-binding protein ZnuA
MNTTLEENNTVAVNIVLGGLLITFILLLFAFCGATKETNNFRAAQAERRVVYTTNFAPVVTF